MIENWKECTNILVIRPDNMGDLLMTSPAIRALKESFNAKITILTSSMAAGIVSHIPEIDEVMVYDLPWVKTKEEIPVESFSEIIEEIRERNFNAAVIFTVYSQNPLPTAMLAYLAGVPRRLAYCRENPYQLLSHWIPDKEPFTFIQHQVRRDLELVKRVGAISQNESLSLAVNYSLLEGLNAKLRKSGIDLNKPWLILHPGVSELKREYPVNLWIETGKKLSKDFQLLITGAKSEADLTREIQKGIDEKCFSLAGELNLSEFILLIKQSPLIVSVNTGTIHIAAACGTPVIVLYALTNPQHSPWKVGGKVLTFDVADNLKSRNEVINYVNKTYSTANSKTVLPNDILEAINEVLSGKAEIIPEMIDPDFTKFIQQAS